MQLTHEAGLPRWGIMLATWSVGVMLIVLHTTAVRDYVALLDAQGLRGAAEPSTPLRQVIPARHADAQVWVRHTLAAEEAGELRVRFTTADNAPAGREVHWSSPLSWLLRFAQGLQQAVTAQGGPLALERTVLWFNAPLLLVLLVGLSAWAAHRAGAGAGVLIASGMIGHRRFYEGFAPTYVDHHGLLNAAALGLLLGLAFMGGGWWKPATAGRTPLLPTSRKQAWQGAVVSALCGAAGLWLSTATVMPVIALAGAAGLVLTLWRGRQATREGATFDPSLWRWWGRVGAAASVAFYLVEYAPAHLGLRLEVNHPLYALLWWGGAEMVALIGAWRLAPPPAAAPAGAKRAPSFPVGRLLMALAAAGAAPIAVLLGGRAVFMVGDPFVGDLRHFVAEGMSLPAMAAQFGFRAVAYDLTSSLLLVPAMVVLWRRRDAAGLLPGYLTLVAAAMIALAFLEMRWWLNASAGQLVLLLGLLALAPAATPRARWGWILGAAGLLFLLPALGRIATAQAENHRGAVTAGDLMQPLYRDVAVVLRQSQPEGDIVLLASPNASAGIGYFGRFATLGTLFWENAPGLRAAAEIFSATTDDEAATLIRARRVTHVVIIAKANFLGEYYRLLHPRSLPEDARRSFGYRLAANLSPPRWLQPIPYRRPDELKETTQTVRLFKVAFAQTELECLYHTAIAQLADGDGPAAEKTLAAALVRAPAEAQAPLLEAAGAASYDYGADAAAVRLLRRRLTLAPDAAVANTVAWILATSRDDALRNGREAFALVEPMVRREPADVTVLSTYAAACAELGQFREAVSAAERALGAARAARDAEAVALLQRRLETYRANRPWRQ